MMREAFTVGVVLMAKDMYSSFVAKAQRDITRLGQVSKVQADEFSRSLAKWQKFGAVGLGITAVSSKVAGVFEDMVRQAGQSESSISRAFISMGGSAGMSREKLALFFSQQQTQWGNMTEEVSGALVSARGRLGDTQKGLDAVSAATVLSAARNVDLGESVDLVTRMYGLFGGGITSANTTQGKFRVIASEVSTALKSAGGDTDELGSILGTFAVKAAGAGQSLETVLGLIAMLGASGAGPRFAMGMMQLFDKMSESRQNNPEQYAAWYPTTARTGNAIDFLTEIQKRLVALGATDARAQFDLLNSSFGDAAPVISFLLTHMDQLTAKVKAQSLAGKDLTGVERQAADQMNTWDGVQKRLHGRVEEFKEMLGSGALPIVKSFDRAVGGMLQTMTGAPGIFKTFLAGGAGALGLGAEAGKVIGPGMTAISAIQLFSLNQKLAAALAAAGGGVATGAAGAGVTGAASAGVAGIIGAAGGVAAFAGIIIAAIGVAALQAAAAYTVGHWIRQKLGIPSDAEVIRALTQPKSAGPQYPHWTHLGATAEPGFVGPPAPGALGSTLNLAPIMPTVVPFSGSFASGGPVRRTGLALVHAGEHVLPRGGGAYHAPGSHVTVNLPAFVATGSLDYDVRALARAIIRVLPTELKAQARRYA